MGTVGSLGETVQLFIVAVSWHSYKGAYYKPYGIKLGAATYGN